MKTSNVVRRKAILTACFHNLYGCYVSLHSFLVSLITKRQEKRNDISMIQNYSQKVVWNYSEKQHAFFLSILSMKTDVENVLQDFSHKTLRTLNYSQD